MRTNELQRFLSRIMFALLFLVTVGASTVFAKTIYVDPDGNDAYTGSQPEFQGGLVGPKRTITAALAIAEPGDVISIEAADNDYVYNENVTVAVNNLRFEARAVGTFTEVVIGGTFTNDATGTEVGTQGSGSFQINGDGADNSTVGDVILQSGTLTVSGVDLPSASTIVRTGNASVSGSFDFLGQVHLVYTGTPAAPGVNAGAEVPASNSLSGGDLTVQFGAARTLTLDAPLTVDDVTLNNNSTVAGTLMLQGNGGGDNHIVAGNDGTVTSVTAAQNSTITGLNVTGNMTVSSGTVSVDAASEVAGTLAVNGGTLNLAADAGVLDLNGGTTSLTGNVTAGDFEMASGSTFNLSGQMLTVTDDFTRSGGTFNGATGTLAFTGNANSATIEVGPAFSVQNLTINKNTSEATDAVVTNNIGVTNDFTVAADTRVALAASINMDGAGAGTSTVNGELTGAEGQAGTIGGVVFTAGGQNIQGLGYNNVTILDPGLGTITATGDVAWSTNFTLASGSLNLASTFTLNASTPGADFIVEFPNGGWVLNGAGLVGTNNTNFDLTYRGTQTADRVVGDEFATDDLSSLTVNISEDDTAANTNTLFNINASAAPGGTIEGPVVLTGSGFGGLADAYSVTFPTANVIVQGNVSVDRNLTLNKTAGTLEVEGNRTVTVNGQLTGAHTLLLDGTIQVNGGTATADQSILQSVVIDNGETVTIAGIQDIQGTLTTNTNANLTLGMSQESDVQGDITLNGAAFTMTSRVDAHGDIVVNSGTVALGGNLVVSSNANGADVFIGSNVSSISGAGFLEFDVARNLDANGNTVPNVRLDADVTLTDVLPTATGTTGAVDSEDFVISGTFAQGTNGAEFISNGNAVTHTGSATIAGGTFFSGAGEFVASGSSMVLSGNANASNIRTAGTGFALTSTGGTFDLTITSELETDAGTLSQDGTDIIITGAGGLDYDGGTFTSSGGFIEMQNGNIIAASSLTIPNFSVENAGNTVQLQGAGTTALTVTNNLMLKSGTFDGDGDTDLVLQAGATLTRWDDGFLGFTDQGETRTFQDFISVVYGDNGANSGPVGNTGSELPGTVVNLTIWDDTNLASDVTVNNTLFIGAFFNTTANDGDNSPAQDDDVTLADGATIELQGPTANINESIGAAGSYTLVYDDIVRTISTAEFPTAYNDGRVNLIVRDDNTGGGNPTATAITLDRAREVNVFNLVTGSVDMNGFHLGTRGDVTLNGAFTNSGARASFGFEGGENVTFSIPGTLVVPTNIDVELDKTGVSTVNLTGGGLDFRTNNQDLILNGGMLNTGNNVITLFQGMVNVPNVGNQPDQGFVRNATPENPSHVVGFVRKNVDNANTVDNTRIDFPVGDDDGNYRLAQFFFTQAPQSNVDLTVSHNDAAPGGSNGFPLTPGGGAVDIGGPSDFYWFVSSDQTLSPGTTYDIALHAEDPAEGDDAFTFDPNNIQAYRIIRRQGPVGGLGVNNPWSVQGGNYDNFVDADGDPTLVARSSSGNITQQGVVFAYGVEDVGPTAPVLNPASPVTVAEGGTLVVTATSTDPNGTPVTFSLQNAPAFVTVDPATGAITINPTNQDAGTYTFNVVATSGNMTATTPLQVVVTDVALIGDVSGDDRINALDASLILQHLAGTNTLSAAQLARADVDNSGTVNSLDASLILQFSVTLITEFPDNSGNAVAAAEFGQGTVEVAAWGTPSKEGDLTLLPITLKGGQDVYGMTLRVTVPVGAIIESVQAAENWMLAQGTNGNVTTIAIAGAEAISSGDVLVLKLRDLKGSEGVSAEAQVNNLPVQQLGKAEVLPTEFLLGDNYPNPFTTSTRIDYALPEAVNVRISVIDVQGRVVKTLVAQPQEAGTYTIEWNGTNDSGAEVASGVYFYQIQAGNFVQAKKVMLVK